jgi:hypothetical protein
MGNVQGAWNTAKNFIAAPGETLAQNMTPGMAGVAMSMGLQDPTLIPQGTSVLDGGPRPNDRVNFGASSIPRKGLAGWWYGNAALAADFAEGVGNTVKPWANFLSNPVKDVTARMSPQNLEKTFGAALKEPAVQKALQENPTAVFSVVDRLEPKSQEAVRGEIQKRLGSGYTLASAAHELTPMANFMADPALKLFGINPATVSPIAKLLFAAGGMSLIGGLLSGSNMLDILGLLLIGGGVLGGFPNLFTAKPQLK